MTIRSESLEVGKCYLAVTGHVRRIMQLMPDGRVLFEFRPSRVQRNHWAAGIEAKAVFLSLVKQEVPCDWTAEPTSPRTAT